MRSARQFSFNAHNPYCRTTPLGSSRDIEKIAQAASPSLPHSKTDKDISGAVQSLYRYTRTRVGLELCAEVGDGMKG
jgi:hypothetical protein